MAKKTAVEKTNAMRKLDAMKIPFREYTYPGDGSMTGVEIAAMLGHNMDQVFKTLVTVGRSGEHYVFMIPVADELDLKKAISSSPAITSAVSMRKTLMFSHILMNIMKTAKSRPA